MFKKLRKSKRAVSEILASVIIISLVIAATAIVSTILTNINVVDLFGYLVEPEPKEVRITLDVLSINDTNLDSLSDTIILHLSLNVDSPNIYIHDVDLQLSTGSILDEITPWSIVSTSQAWSDEFSGYIVVSGYINASFTVQINDLTSTKAELSSGQVFNLIFYYIYLSDLGGKVSSISSYYVSSFLHAP